MWALILIVYTADVNMAQVGMVRGLTTETACDEAGKLGQKFIKRGVRYDYICVPVRASASRSGPR